MLPIYMVLVDDDDVSDFEVLYRECRNKAYIIAYKILKNESLAEECVSEVFLSVAKNFKKVNNLTSYEKQKYVVISVRNKAFNILTKEKIIHRICHTKMIFILTTINIRNLIRINGLI